jgi:competence protein ComEC
VNILVALAAAWLLGLALGTSLNPGLWQAIVGILALASGLLIAAASSRLERSLSGAAHLTLAMLAAISALGAGIASAPLPPPDGRLPPTGLARVQAAVERVEYGPDSSEAASIITVLKGERVEDGMPFPAGIHLLVKPIPLPENARVEILTQVSPWAPLRNPSPHPALPRINSVLGLGRLVSSNAVKIVAQGGICPWLYRARHHARLSIEKTLPPEVAGLTRALALGESHAIDAARNDAVRLAGLAHVLAVSGMHVTILLGFSVMALAQLLSFVPPLAKRYEIERIAYAVGVPLAILYAEFSGGSPSAWRAAVTASIGWTLRSLGYRPAATATCAATAILLGSLNPRLAVDPSFALSIAATAAVLSARPATGHGLGRWLKTSFNITARATLATAPIIIWCFGNVPLIGLVANLMLVPIGELVMIPLAAGHALLASISVDAAIVTGWPLTTVTRAFVKCCELFSALAPADPLPPPDLAQGVTLACVCCGLLTFRSRRTILLFLSVGLICYAAFEMRLRTSEKPRDQLRVTFLDVGEGDSALVDLPDGRSMLIDAGGSLGAHQDLGQKVILPILLARRRTQIDIAVLTHPHPDHIGGMKTLLSRIRIKELWDTGQARAEWQWQKNQEMREAKYSLDLADKLKIRIRGPDELCHQPRQAGGASISLLWPCPGYDPGLSPNDNSMVIRLDYQNQRLLLAGDIEAEVESALVNRGVDVRANLLKVAHHGSATSSTERFLRIVAPKLAIISAGAANRYGHPHPRVIDRLTKLGATVLRTDRRGGITVTVKDGKLSYQ